MSRKIIYCIALIQIFLILSLTFINAIGSRTEIYSNKTSILETLKDSAKKGLNLVVAFLEIKQFGIVSAAQNCCKKTISGGVCQIIMPGDEALCAPENLLNTACSLSSECVEGCCIDKITGTCAARSTRYACESGGGTWKRDQFCLNSECILGCCTLENKVEFVTEKTCRYKSQNLGLQMNYIKTNEEWECINMQRNQSEGACMLQDDRCVRTSNSECVRQKGKYYPWKLCSNPITNSSCIRQSSVNCVEGVDEVYWFDSCGNKENIYSSDKEKSWRGGIILNKSNGCDPLKVNTNSETCGNCDRFLGSTCSANASKKVKDGNVGCKNLDCVDEKGKSWHNGESWCVYDGYIGDGKDVVGSRHWRRYCSNGQIKVDPCADYRAELCSQTLVVNSTSSDGFNVASCIFNEAFNCINYNLEMATMPTNCALNGHCYMKSIKVDDYFYFSICLPKYPRGFDLETPSTLNQQICSTASQSCKVWYEKKITGWECIENCDCEENEFAKTMNEICTSLGDCGSKVNWVGDGTENIRVAGGQYTMSSADYKQYATPVAGQTASTTASSASAGKTSTTPNKKPENLGNTIVGWVGSILGGLGVLGAVVIYFTSITVYSLQISSALSASQLAAANPVITGLSGVDSFTGMYVTDPSMATVSNSVPTGIGKIIAPYVQWIQMIGTWIAIGTIVSLIFGLQGDAVWVTTASAVAGGITGYFGGLGWAGLVGGQAGGFWGAVIFAIIAAIVMTALRVGDTDERNVYFTCSVWQPPIENQKCEECNKDKLKPCSKYRCESLGTGCKLINEFSENPICDRIPNDAAPPNITPMSIRSGYTLINESKTGFIIKECVPEFTPFVFTLKFDEYAQCRYSLNQTAKFDDMLGSTIESNIFKKNHSFMIFMPSVESVEQFRSPTNGIDIYGLNDIFIKCRDVNGNYNIVDYTVRFCVNQIDITPPFILASSPPNISYLKYGQEAVNLSLALNEPADCKWSREDKNYNSMENKMSCSMILDSRIVTGGRCNSYITNLSSEENLVYIRCKDKSWLPEDNETRNINVQSMIYSMKKSKLPLKIDSIGPSGEIETGFQPMSVTLEVETSGGVENGRAICYYDADGERPWVAFENTLERFHRTTFQTIMEGDYEFRVLCEDIAGNNASATSSIKVKMDVTPPEVIRASHEIGRLIIQTNEDSLCYFTNSSCSFDVVNSQIMSSGYSKSHSAKWDEGKKYFIRCGDIWNNFPNACSITISPETLFSLFLIKFINKGTYGI